ncbi:DUF5056 domain-containing protein [uncultured Bacteroides sp.]|uniref:DUF5056 domain-containing protein n=1 Tax=uncultured Bacteroides sp. TaxID=162156 RepID=UPI002AA81379|nr:DUF5056 domain-containing protein [uncultured Bacteroides sp.]
MMDTNDKLLKQFFDERKQEIKDNGFSHRITHNLPNHNKRLSNLWISFCVAITLILFITLNGLQAIIGVLRDVFISLVQNGIEKIDPKSLLIAIAVLMFLGVRKVCTMA